MKTITVIILLLCMLCFDAATSQIAGNKPFDKYYQRKGIVADNELKTKNVFYFTSTFPFSVGRIEKADEWQLNPAFGVGNGGLFVFGKSTYNGTNARRIEPVFSFGIAADVGVKQTEADLKTTFNGNLMLGFHWVNLMMGYDFLDQTKYFGLALRIDLISFSPNSIYIFREREAKRLR